MKKRFPALFLVLAMCLALLPTAALAAGATSGECGEYVIWSLDTATGTLTVSGTGGMSLSWEAAYEMDAGAIRKVDIKEGITSISERAFNECPNITQVSIPKSVTSVGADAFSGTLWLKSLGEFAISNNFLLKYQGSEKNVVIPNGVTHIACGAFYGNEYITGVVIPEGVVDMGIGAFGYVFNGCTNLESITFPSTLKYIGRFSFTDTKWEANQKGDFVMAGSMVVRYQGKNTSVVIPDGVTSLADGSFQDMDDDVIPTSLTVPVSMQNLNFDMAFFMGYGDYLPKTIIYKGTQAQWEKVDGVKDSALLADPGNHITVQCTGTEAAAPDQPAVSSGTANPSNNSLIVNGQPASTAVYKIDGSNYFKLRDVAALLNGSGKQFNVGYDAAAKAAAITSGQGYEKQPTDLQPAPAGAQKYSASKDAVLINGNKAALTAYKIGGANYFKLRDLGQALDFYVGYDNATKSVFIDTSRSYDPNS